MDPDVTLRDLREWIDQVLREYPTVEGEEPETREQGAAIKLAELDEWMSRGGFKPGPWAARPCAPRPPIETVWCEAHGGLAHPHFERADCVHPHLTDMATRARLNAAQES